MLRQISLYDEETGEFISSNTTRTGSKLREGWIVVYKEPLIKLLNHCPNYATLKVYLRIAAAQDYDTVTYISTRFLTNDLGMAYQTVWNAVKWLIKNDYIRRAKNETGASGFIVNPLISTCGRKNLSEKLDAFADEEEDYSNVSASSGVPLEDIFGFSEEPPEDSTLISEELFNKMISGEISSPAEFESGIIEPEEE